MRRVGIQALERTQPMLPLGLGYCRRSDPRLSTPRHHHAVCRVGHGQWQSAHAMSDSATDIKNIWVFSEQIEKNVPQNPVSKCRLSWIITPPTSICEQRWFAARPRFHVHFTPHLCLLAQSGGDLVQPHYATSHSPGNLQQRERTWSRKSITTSRKSTAICVSRFVWTATADSIFAKVERLCERISGTAH